MQNIYTNNYSIFFSRDKTGKQNSPFKKVSCYLCILIGISSLFLSPVSYWLLCHSNAINYCLYISSLKQKHWKFNLLRLVVKHFIIKLEIRICHIYHFKLFCKYFFKERISKAEKLAVPLISGCKLFQRTWNNCFAVNHMCE